MSNNETLFIFIPDNTEKNAIDLLTDIVIKIMRSPNGCQWDREQTHQTIRQNMLEEAYEAAEAIDENNPEHIKEELGDVLLQVVLHAQIAKDNNEFDIQDVAKMLNDKLIEYADTHEIAIKCTAIHGEQKHNSRIDSSYWMYQHTWALVTINEISIYVDPTSSQFKYLYSDIPDFYISTIAPPWYYPDLKNPAFHPAFTRWIDEHIKIPLLHYKRFNGKCPKAGIIEFFQYEIWGRLCDMKRKFLNKKNNK